MRDSDSTPIDNGNSLFKSLYGITNPFKYITGYFKLLQQGILSTLIPMLDISKAVSEPGSI
jgi:hypothetical protein